MENVLGDRKACKICDKTFSRPSNLNKHIRLIHGEEPKSHKKCSLVCPSCFRLFDTYCKFRDHLITDHEFKLFKEEKQFVDYSEFQSWKELKEKEMKCSYVKTSGKKSCGKLEKTYFVCHRSAKLSRDVSISHSDHKRFLKSQGSSKLTVTCPSTLELICKGKEFKATLFTPHLGHKCNLMHINLTKTERKQIAGKITEGVSFQKILDDIRDGIDSKESLGRLSLLDRQDLRNITRDFSLQGHVQLHKTDVISVSLWIERFKQQTDEFPVLFYKAQGSNEFADLYEENDFVLIFMTKFQVNQLLTFGSDKICVDSTHGTTNYDFLLTTLMVVDEFGEGVPTAFMLSNKADTSVLTHFFQIIKMQTGDIKCKVFMSDDASEFYNSWTSTMSVPDNRLLCAWHVDKNWRKNLNKIKGDQATKAKIYKSLRMLLQTKDTFEFEELQEFIINELVGCEDTVAFGEYFKTYYVDRCHLWAYCYRQGLGINTNMFLESMHRTLKHIYFQGKKNKRVDMCLHSLLKLVRDITIKKLKRNIKGNNSYRMDLIRKSHLLSTSIKIDDIYNIDEVSWNIKSAGETDEHYIVQKQTDECFRKSKNCHLFCKQCQICVHEYTCTCLDFFIKNNLCKHIHAVIQNCLKSVIPIPKAETDEVTEEIISNIISQNFKGEESNNQDLKSKLDVAYELLSVKSLTSESKVRAGKIIDNFIDVIAKENHIALKDVSSAPANKKAEKQLRFTSTKKKRVTNSLDLLKKPTTSDIKQLVDECDNKVRESDHLYTNYIGLFKE